MAGLGNELFIIRGPSGVSNLGTLGSTNDGTYQGGMGVVSDTDDGGVSAFSFDGINDCITVPAVDLSSTDKVTVTFWAKKASYTNTDQIVLEVTSTTNNLFSGAFVGLLVTLDSGNPTPGFASVGHRGNAGYSIARATRPTVNEWHFYTCEYDRSKTTEESTMWIDGVFASTPAFGFNTNSTNNFGNAPVFIGARNNASLRFNGLLDDIHIYDRVLTTDEIAELYTGQRGYDRPTFNPAWAINATQVIHD